MLHLKDQQADTNLERRAKTSAANRGECRIEARHLSTPPAREHEIQQQMGLTAYRYCSYLSIICEISLLRDLEELISILSRQSSHVSAIPCTRHNTTLSCCPAAG